MREAARHQDVGETIDRCESGLALRLSVCADQERDISSLMLGRVVSALSVEDSISQRSF
jgi:hypothetical protein